MVFPSSGQRDTQPLLLGVVVPAVRWLCSLAVAHECNVCMHSNRYRRRLALAHSCICECYGTSYSRYIKPRLHHNYLLSFTSRQSPLSTGNDKLCRYSSRWPLRFLVQTQATGPDPLFPGLFPPLIGLNEILVAGLVLRQFNFSNNVIVKELSLPAVFQATLGVGTFHLSHILEISLSSIRFLFIFYLFFCFFSGPLFSFFLSDSYSIPSHFGCW